MAFAYLIVRARGQLCALPIVQVVEVLRLPALTGGRLAAQGWLGTGMLRGELVGVLELGALLGFAESESGAGPGIQSRLESGPESGLGSDARRAVAVRLLAVRAGLAPEEMQAVLAVDEVIGVRRLEDEHLRRIALPGGGELPLGKFDAGFARLVDASGLVDVTALQAHVDVDAGVAA